VSDKPLDLHLFEQVADGLHSLVPSDLGPWHQRNHRYGIKVWFGDRGTPNREHYEAQVVGPKLVPGAKVLALEVGFHAEHPDRAANRAVLGRLSTPAATKRWRATLGDDAEATGFLGNRAKDWIRVSETWPDPDLSDPDLPFELAARLTDFVVALQPLLVPDGR
jgi:hypothetical protein